MPYRVRDWINAQGRPLAAEPSGDYDADAIRLLLDDLGDAYRHDFPAVAAHVRQIQAAPGWCPPWERPARCARGHLDPPWYVVTKGGHTRRICGICRREQEARYTRVRPPRRRSLPG